MRVMWCSIFEGTPIMFAVGERLRAQGHRVFWSATHSDWHGYLTGMGVDEGEILDLRVPRDGLPRPSPEIVEALVQTELRTGLTVASAVLSDRFAVSRRKSGLEASVVWMFTVAREFLQRNRVAVVLGEPTNASDLATYLACESLGTPYCHIASIRVPANRSALFSGVTDSNVVEVSGLESGGRFQDPAAAVSREERPFWFAQNSDPDIYRRPPQVLKILRKLLRPSPRGDFESYSPARNAEIRLRSRLNAFWVRNRLGRLVENSLPPRFVLFPLQVHPERSVDVFAPFTSNQLELIKNVRRALPSDLALVVKEHPNFLGSRGRAFFREVAHLPSTFLVDPFTNSFDLVKQSVAVVSISSTMLLEAALLGVPAIAFAEPWFTGLSKARYCRNPQELPDLIEECAAAAHDEAADEEILRFVLDNSVDGMLGNPKFIPSVDFDENANQLARLVSAYLKKLAEA